MQHAAYRLTPTVSRGGPQSAGVGLARAPGAIFARLAAWQRRAEERARLAQLTDHQLQDMGLSRAAAEDMARKPFWVR